MLKRALVLLIVVLGLSVAGSTASAATSCTYSVAPAVSTSSPGTITTTSAVLKATVNPGGCATTYHFQYGNTTAYGSNTPTVNLAGSGSLDSVSATVTGLAPDTTYHYRIVAENEDGSVVGDDHSFMTVASCAATDGKVPTVKTGATTSITTVSAKLNGTVSPNGCPTEYDFQYGTTSDYGATTPLISSSATTGTLKPSAALAALTPGTVYHVRLVATSSVGTSYGADQTFTTVAPCATNATPAPAAVTDPATGVGSTTATFHGVATTQGCAAQFRFDYGTTIGYGSSTPVTSLTGSATPLPEAVTVAGLSPHTLYHARLVVSTAVGVSYGSDITFSTNSRFGSTVSIASDRVVVMRNGRTMVLLGCLGTQKCVGVLRLLRGRRVVARVAFVIAPDQTGHIALRLYKAERRLLKHTELLRLQIVVTYGNGRSAKQPLRLSRSKR